MSHQPFVDVFRFNDELDMLEYRLRLMSPMVDTFAVVECDVTDSGAPKPLHAHQLLMSRAASVAPGRTLRLKLPGGQATGLITEVRLREPAAKVLLLNLCVRSIDVAKHAKHTPAFSRELVIRKFMTRFVGESFPQSRVFVSDVDELLDPGFDAASFRQHRPCMRPRLRHFWFGDDGLALQLCNGHDPYDGEAHEVRSFGRRACPKVCERDIRAGATLD